MAELELTRSDADRRLYRISGVGELRFEGLLSRRAAAKAGGVMWSFAQVGLWKTTLHACDAAGADVGSFTPHTVQRGGSLRWGVHELQLSAATQWRERYALADHGCELAVFDAKSWGKRPVKIVIDNPGLVQPGLVLFAAFTVRQLAADAGATAASAAATASTT